MGACECWCCILLTCFLLHSKITFHCCSRVFLQTINFKCSCQLLVHVENDHLIISLFALIDSEEEGEGLRAWDGAFGAGEDRLAAENGRAQERAESAVGRDWDRPCSSTDCPARWWPGLYLHCLRLVLQKTSSAGFSANWQHAFWQSLKTPWNHLIHFCPEIFSLYLVQALIALF